MIVFSLVSGHGFGFGIITNSAELNKLVNEI